LAIFKRQRLLYENRATDDLRVMTKHVHGIGPMWRRY